MPCELRHFDDIRCMSGLQKHHIIPRAALRNSPRARKFVDENPEIFLADLCPAHHLYGTAHKREARAHLLFRRCVEYGVKTVRDLVNDVPWNNNTPEYSFEGMMAGTQSEDLARQLDDHVDQNGKADPADEPLDTL